MCGFFEIFYDFLVLEKNFVWMSYKWGNTMRTMKSIRETKKLIKKLK